MIMRSLYTTGTSIINSLLVLTKIIRVILITSNGLHTILNLLTIKNSLLINSTMINFRPYKHNSDSLMSYRPSPKSPSLLPTIILTLTNTNMLIPTNSCSILQICINRRSSLSIPILLRLRGESLFKPTSKK